MIKLLKSGLLSVALLATVAVNASKIITTKTANSKVVSIALTDVSKGELLSIKDTNGVLLYTKELEKAGSFSKTFDFSTLPIGVYFLEEKQSKKISVTPIIIKDNDVVILSNTTKTYKAPKISIDGSTASILVSNYNEETIKVTITDEGGKEFISESDTKLLLYKGYDFSNLEKGIYTISVSMGDYTFIEDVKF